MNFLLEASFVILEIEKTGFLRLVHFSNIKLDASASAE